MASIDDDLSLVRRTVLRRLEGLDVDVFLFGSRATGRASRGSDIDVGLLSREPLPKGLLSEIREDLEESCVPYFVELVDLSETDEIFRERVQREGIRWAA